ncbi:MAG: exosortase/archaeosortase family protein [Candidatus Heimdallarchaeota archaeon]|nr:exosortase/archaeosortase family protein [Candidatus Heimdallarchaeota archaeon]MCK4953787.1 exosortase/archaeosortase family protein [Candidatus Heimdallarchaeota archaeon]
MDESQDFESSAKVEVDSKQDSLSIIMKAKTKLSKFISGFKDHLKTLGDKMNPIFSPFKTRIFRYTFSLILLAFVVYFYIMFEGHRSEEMVRILFFDYPTRLLVPIGIVFAFIASLLLTWNDQFFGKYRSPALYMIFLTAIFYTLIYSGVDEYLFRLSIAEWLTKITGVVTTALLRVFGLNIVDSVWNVNTGMTLLTFNGPDGLKSIAIDARCSGIHSLTIFFAIFLLMLFEARKRLKFDFKTAVVTLVGILGTYLINILRVIVIIFIFYFRDWSVAGPVHDYLGYVFLIMWVPIFWLFVLPKSEKKTN